MTVRRTFSCAVLAGAALVSTAGQAAPENAGTSNALLETPAMAEPAYLQPTRDPVFGTPLVRITAPERAMAGGRCGTRYCTHRYSTAQAWNADQSLLVIVNGCSGACFLNGRTFQPLFRRDMAGECEWHPTDPAAMICVDGRAVYVWLPRTNRRRTVHTLPTYSGAQFGPYKGNPSADGERIVVRARDAQGRRVAFAFDLTTGRIHPPIDLSKIEGENNYCTISASGAYIVCGQDLPEEKETLYVFTADGEPVQHWAEHHRPGHGDLTIDPDGADVYVGISKSDPDRFHVIKRRLSDGLITDLLPYGQVSHASLRNTRRSGWVFLSFTGDRQAVEGTPDNGKAPFYQEVLALRTDGSRTVRRIAQTRNAAADYWSETHATPSPDGSHVIWSSNWGRAGGPVSDYVSTVDWPDSQRDANGEPLREAKR